MYEKSIVWVGGFIIGGVFVSIVEKTENPAISGLIILGCLCSLIGILNQKKR